MVLVEEQAFYFPFPVEDGLRKIAAEDSPLEYEGRIFNLDKFSMILKNHRGILNFVYEPVSESEMNSLLKDYLKEAVNFEPKSGLYTVHLELGSMELLDTVVTYFGNKGIRFYRVKAE